MQRRTFLAAALPLGSLPLGAVALAAPREAERHLERPWRLPRGAAHELRLDALGLDLAGALAATDAWSVPPDATLVLRLAEGEHHHARTLAVRHPAGARLAIVGNREHPERCRLLWSGPDDGLYVGAGCVLGLLDGLTLEHAAPGRRALGSAVLADEGGTIRCGSAVHARHFYYGFQARIGGVIRCAGTRSHGAGDANYFAFNGGHLYARKALATGARDERQGLGSGFVAEYGGSIDAEGAAARENLLAGFSALSNGVIRAHGAVAERNGRPSHTDSGGRVLGLGEADGAAGR